MTLNRTSETSAKLALLGGDPVRTPESRQYPKWSPEAIAHVNRLLENGVALGLSKAQPEIGAIEAALSEYHGVRHALGTSTGNGALHAALIGLELTDGDEVITSPYTYGVSISCILHNNCIPTFADVIEGTGLLDPESIREQITDRTGAILVPHIFGSPADMTAINQIAAQHGLKVIEDGSQAHGARHRGERIGGLGDAAGFSANGVKPVAATEAGYMLTKHDEVYWKAVVSTQHAGMGEYPGRSKDAGFMEEFREAIDSLVYTFRLAPINAALMLHSLRRVDQDNDVRRAHLDILSDGLKELTGVSVPSLLHDGDTSAIHQVLITYDEQVTGVSKQTYMEAVNAEGLYCYQYLTRPVYKAARLSPNWTGPRVMWTENLKRSGYDATKLYLPHVENQIRTHFNLLWNFIDYDPKFIQGMVDVFAKVDKNLDQLRGYESR